MFEICSNYHCARVGGPTFHLQSGRNVSALPFADTLVIITKQPSKRERLWFRRHRSLDYNIVITPGAQFPVIRGCIENHGHRAPYPNLWKIWSRELSMSWLPCGNQSLQWNCPPFAYAFPIQMPVSFRDFHFACFFSDTVFCFLWTKTPIVDD